MKKHNVNKKVNKKEDTGEPSTCVLFFCFTEILY